MCECENRESSIPLRLLIYFGLQLGAIRLKLSTSLTAGSHLKRGLCVSVFCLPKSYELSIRRLGSLFEKLKQKSGDFLCHLIAQNLEDCDY